MGAAVGIALVFGTAVQVACVLASTILWRMRKHVRANLWAPWPTGIGGLVGWIAAMIPASELLRIGPANLPACLSQDACRADATFSATWFFVALLLIGLQIWLYRRTVKS